MAEDANKFEAGLKRLFVVCFAEAFSCSLLSSSAFEASGFSISHFRKGLLMGGLVVLPFSNELPFCSLLKLLGFKIRNDFFIPSFREKSMLLVVVLMFCGQMRLT